MDIKRILIIFLIFLVSNNVSHADLINIKVQIQDEIVTNIDIENEKKYLFFLNPKLRELEKSRVDTIAKNSLITDIIKKKELVKFFDLTKKNNFIEILEKNLLIRKNIKTKEKFIQILKENEIDYQSVQRKLQIEALWNRLIFQKYSKNLVINKRDLKQSIVNQFNNENQKFKYNLSEIIFSESIDVSFEEKILKIKESIKEIGFENTANIYSISNTSKNGGLIGWINELQISDQINKNIKNLKINQISKAIKISSGYILIKVNDKKELKQEMNLEKELKKLVNEERNRQLNNFSIIFFKRLKKNIDINEY